MIAGSQQIPSNTEGVLIIEPMWLSIKIIGNLLYIKLQVFHGFIEVNTELIKDIVNKDMLIQRILMSLGGQSYLVLVDDGK